MSNYRTWVRLNQEGKLQWGDVFAEDKVPVQSIVTQHPILEGTKDVESVFTVNWNELTPHQQQAIIEKLSKQTDATKEAISKRYFVVWVASSKDTHSLLR